MKRRLPTPLFLAVLLAAWPALAAPGAGGGPKGGDRGGSHGQSSGRPGSAKARTPGDQLAQHSALSARLEGLLPEGTDLQKASAGFRNLGQFVSAVHVSRNLGIPFDQLRDALVNEKLSLGQAIQHLRPKADAPAEAARGETQAREDLGTEAL
jgi:hypothetical protein